LLRRGVGTPEKALVTPLDFRVSGMDHGGPPAYVFWHYTTPGEKAQGCL
jgi:hypothetical protein